MSKNSVEYNHRSFITTGILLFLFALIYLFFFLRVLWRIGDEGTLVYGAQLVAQGSLPYRDFFEVMGPGSFYWLALFFKLFGIHFWVARAVLLLTGALITLLIYWMTRRLYRGPLDLLPSLFFLVVSIPLWPGTSHHWDSDLFALLSVAAFFLWQDRRRWWLLALAGVLAGLTSCFLQQKGVLLVLTLLLLVWVNGYRAGESKVDVASDAGLLLAGFAAVVALVLIFFYASGGLPELLYANLVWPLNSYRDINRLPYGYFLQSFYLHYYEEILPLLSTLLSRVMALLLTIPLLLIVCLPALLMVLAGFASLDRTHRDRIFSARMLPYWAVGFALWISELHRPDIFHLIYGSPLLPIILLVICSQVLANQRKVFIACVGLIMVGMALFGTFNLLPAVGAWQEIASRRGSIYAPKQDSALQFLMERTKPGDYVFVYPYYPMYYFLADLKNPTRYSILLYHINTDDQFKEVLKDLEQKRVKYVLWDTLVAGKNLQNWFPNYQQPYEQNLYLERYLEDHYLFIDILNGFKIMRLRSEKRAPGTDFSTSPR